jgi:hypothetical protein
MHRWIRPLILSVTLLAAGTAMAQSTAPNKAGPRATPEAGQTVDSSALTGVVFAVKPVPLGDDKVYTDLIDGLAAQKKRHCRTMESYGWTFKKGDQTALDNIVQPTMEGLGKNGYEVTSLPVESAEVPNAAAFTATKRNREILGVWLPSADAVVLLQCQTEEAF